SGASRYPVVEVSASIADVAVPPLPSPVVAAPTGVQSSLLAVAVISVYLVQLAANRFALPPEQVAHRANARLPAASKSVTLLPLVFTWVQFCPALCVAHSSGPNAQPLTPSRNRSPLTPVAPTGPVVAGAGSPRQVLPVSPVRAIDVQMLGSGLAHVPGIPA